MNKIKVGLLFITICICVCGCRKSAKAYMTQIDDLIDSYNEESVTYEEANNEIDKIRNDTDNEAVQSKIREKQIELDKLKVSKNAFKDAKNADDNGDYESAIEYYLQVIEEDKNYEAAQQAYINSGEMYLESIRNLCDDYIEEEKYTDAISMLEQSKDVYDDGSAEGWIDETKIQYKEYMEQQIDELVENEDYQTAIVYCNDLNEYFEDESFNDKKSEIEEVWSTKVINESEQYLSEGDYSNAKNVLSIPLVKMKDNEALKAQEERVEEFSPVDLFSIDSFAESIGEYVEVKDWISGNKTNTGEPVNSGKKVSILDNMAIGDLKDYRYKVIYNVNGEYDTLTGLFCIDFESKDCTSDQFGAQFFVLADEEDILYQTDGWIKGGDMPIEINLDISGRSQISVGVFVSNFLSKGQLMYTDDFSVGLCDLHLNKTYVPKTSDTNMETTVE